MKHLILICEGMTDDPVEELGERTPLEIAKAPALRKLAALGRTASAQFVPRKLEPSDDAALMSILGFDPLEHYTGPAPLEAAAMGIRQNDNEIAFRCDLVTAFDDALTDTSASRITPKESRILVEALNAKLGGPTVRIHPAEGYKNILVIGDPELADNLDDLECADPKRIIGKPFAKFLPRGKSAKLLTDLMDRSKEVLDGHEINRVRVDLKENPANMIWPWGQGRRPKMPSFKDRFGRGGAMVTDSLASKGLAKLTGLEVYENLQDALDAQDVVFAYMPFDDEIYRTNNLKSKVRLIDDFDQSFVAPALKLLGALDACRVAVVTDRVWSRERKTSLHGLVPVLVAGQGTAPQTDNTYSEKAAANSDLVFEEGHTFIKHFLGIEK